MTVLVDTNVLLRLAQPSHPHFIHADRAIETFQQQGHRLCIPAQVIYEFWVVATRPPVNNGFGMSVEEARHEIEAMKRLFHCLPEAPSIVNIWQRLVVRYRITGRRAHDTRLVAAMQFHGITRLLTFNAQDFSVYSGLEILDPSRM